jgi:hypothetical protein
MIKRMPVNHVRPAWASPVGDRYVSHPDLSFALIQLMDDPEGIYVVQDQTLPVGIVSARDMVARWREANATEET